MKIGGFCINRKVVAGLAVVAVILLAPSLVGAVLPVLLLAACPLSMLFMMRGMGNQGNMPAQPASLPEPHGLDTHLARPIATTKTKTTREEQLAALQGQLAAVRQWAFADEMIALERDQQPAASTPE